MNVNDFVRACIVFQPLIWIYIFEEKIPSRENELKFRQGFFLVSIVAFFTVLFQRISFGHYSTELILVYIVLTNISFIYFYWNRPFYEALSLSFLLVYINSYYWEVILHFTVYNLQGFNINQIFQLMHLWCVPYLIWKYKFEKNETVNLLILGTAISAVFAFVTISRIWTLIPFIEEALTGVYPFNRFLQILNRVLTLLVLVRIFNKHASVKN